jgi:hypothetical protein
VFGSVPKETERLPKRNICSDTEPLRSSKSAEPSSSTRQRSSAHSEVSPGVPHPIFPRLASARISRPRAPLLRSHPSQPVLAPPSPGHERRRPGCSTSARPAPVPQHAQNGEQL